MLTKRQKRKTKLMRVPEYWHRQIKIDAAKERLTIPKFLKVFFREYYPRLKKKWKI